METDAFEPTGATRNHGALPFYGADWITRIVVIPEASKFLPRFIIAAALVVGLAVLAMLAVLLMFPGPTYQTLQSAVLG
ncbi:hypothetical protein [Nocardia sp. NPDC051832]|uniref:hypothetical protein n=1 Tax=Nocardia sp. NPDC051832 TaxID=3155673 RepID=UPI00341740A5